MPHEILHSITHSLIETAKMAPIIFLAYLFMEWLEHTSSRLTGTLHKVKGAGPLIGSALGLIPQCGFSGAIAGMYAAGTVTMGTLLAVLLATSDEMLVIMLPELGKGRITLWILIFILVFKFVIGTLVGFIADFILRKRHAEREEDIHGFCERENCSCSDGVWLSAIKHTLKILLIIFIVSVLLHIALELIPEEAIKSVLNFPILSELFAALVGLVPSCAVSVTLTSLYVEGALGLGPLLCGLLTNGGVGLLVLYRVNKSKKDSLIITAVVFAAGLVFGSLAGLIIG